MRTYCKVQILGNVGQAPKVNESGSVASFSVATSDKQGEERVTTWWNCKAFSKLVEIVQQYVRAGATVLIDGRLQREEWTNKDGEKQVSISVLVDQLNLIKDSDKAPRAEAPAEAPAQAPAKPAKQPEPEQGDLPF